LEVNSKLESQVGREEAEALSEAAQHEVAYGGGDGHLA